MPRMKEVARLSCLCTGALADHFHSGFKDSLHCLPSALQEEIFLKVESAAKAEEAILGEEYYQALAAFINEKTRFLHLTSPRLFQDSSLALESFLLSSSACGSLRSARHSLRELTMSRAVTDLACFEFVPVLEAVAEMTQLRSLTIQGLNQVDLEEEDMLNFLKNLARNCSKLQHLDLTDSTLDHRCCEEISRMSPSLVSICLDHCRVETVGAALILARLRDLVRFDCDDKLQTVAALGEGDLTGGSRLRSATFRHLRGLRQVSRACPELKSLRIIYRAYEEPVGTADRLDQGLGQLDGFAEGATVELELQGMNLLVPNQMSLLPACGHRLVRLCLTQGEFLHPQALNPWARHCPNLRALEVAGCGTVADEMFVGEVPELERLAFPALEELHYEGARLPAGLASFLLEGCRGISRVTLRVTSGRFPSSALRMLADPPRKQLREARLHAQRVEEDFVQILHKVVEVSEVLERLELLLNAEEEDAEDGSGNILSDLEEVERCARRSNWELKFVYHFNNRRRRRRKKL